MANPSPGHLQEGAHPGLLGGTPEHVLRMAQAPLWVALSVSAAWREQNAESPLGFNRCQENKAKSTLVRLPPLDPRL